VEQNAESIELVFDEDHPIGSTREMRTWYTTRPTLRASKSQISHLVVDSSWEAHTANILESSPLVTSYVKNERLGLRIHYLWGGARRRYIPDFIIHLESGKILVLEIKGQDSPQNKAKRDALDLWVKGVNAKGGFGVWSWDVAFDMATIQDILEKHSV